MQETRFKDFVRHVEGRADLTHIFVVTHSTETVYRLRSLWSTFYVIQLYKDYLENFRIHLSEPHAS
jgi:adenine-specific DNA-methyltransferase